jgi:hypothetical protein
MECLWNLCRSLHQSWWDNTFSTSYFYKQFKLRQNLTYKVHTKSQLWHKHSSPNAWFYSLYMILSETYGRRASWQQVPVAQWFTCLAVTENSWVQYLVCPQHFIICSLHCQSFLKSFSRISFSVRSSNPYMWTCNAKISWIPYFSWQALFPKCLPDYVLIFFFKTSCSSNWLSESPPLYMDVFHGWKTLFVRMHLSLWNLVEEH